MRYLDHEPGAWFLVGDGEQLYLDARYSYSAIIDDSALIHLTESEATSYRAGGHQYLSELATGIHNSAPYREESQYFARNLYRGAEGREYRDRVGRAIADHTWAAEQRPGQHPRSVDD